MLQSLDGAAVRQWAVTCCDALAAHRDEIDALNVFPVPDRDTGSNLLATMRAGLDAVRHDHGDNKELGPGSTIAVLAGGALIGARGNSGVILSQVLRGLAEPLVNADYPAWGGAVLRAGLHRADELGEVASAATAAAAQALAETPRQFAALASARVVDAGGRGLILLLEALLAVIHERPAATNDIPAQALAAVAVHDGVRHPAEDRKAMSDAVAATRCAELTLARPGELRGVLDGQTVVINPDPLAAAVELVARLLSAGGELVSVLLGRDAPDGFAEALTEQLRARHPEIEVVVYPGDVPERVLLVGVE